MGDWERLEREGVENGFDQNTLYACLKFSIKMIKKEK